MKIETYGVGKLGTNCYFLINEDTREALCIDPGGDGIALAKQAEKLDIRFCAIMLTHGHYDHVDGVNDLRENLGYSLDVYALDKEEEFLGDMEMSYLNYPFKADKYFKDGDEVELAGLSFKVIATPGHTPGGCCYYFPNEGDLFCGDTLFAGSIGRTDFPGGNYSEIEKSIKNKLYTLPDNTVCYPGHMMTTTIGEEKNGNMFITA